MSYIKHFFSFFGKRQYGKINDPNVPKIINKIDNRIGFKTAHNTAKYVSDMDKRTRESGYKPNQTGNFIVWTLWFVFILTLVTLLFWIAS